MVFGPSGCKVDEVETIGVSSSETLILQMKEPGQPSFGTPAALGTSQEQEF